MGTLYLAANGIFALGNSAAHLQIVYKTDNGEWYEVEVQAPSNLVFGTWDYTDVLDADNPDTWRPHGGDNTDYVSVSGSILNPFFYNRIELNLPTGATAESMWELAIQIHESFRANGSNINYNTTQNSNSYATTVLEAMGFQDVSSLVDQVRPSGFPPLIGLPLPGAPIFPGAGLNVLTDSVQENDVSYDVPRIELQVNGTSMNDTIHAGEAVDIIGGDLGDDVIYTYGGRDIIRPGLGSDTVYGGNGAWSEADSETTQNSTLDPDTVILLGDQEDWTIEALVDGGFAYTNVNTGEVDTLYNVESVIFGGFTDQCFSGRTLITLFDGTSKPIEAITQSDIVLTHDASGKAVPGIVDKLFSNTTSEFVRLSFNDGREDLVTTPGHRFLTETGDYMEIGHMLRLGGGSVRLTDTDGSIIEATGEVIAYSAVTAEMFEQAQTIAFQDKALPKENIEMKQPWDNSNKTNNQLHVLKQEVA